MIASSRMNDYRRCFLVSNNSAHIPVTSGCHTVQQSFPKVFQVNEHQKQICTHVHSKMLHMLISPLCPHDGAVQALVGHQYGSACPPAQVDVSEYQLLLQESQRAGVSTRALERVYRRDENTVPPSYCLRPPQRPNSVSGLTHCVVPPFILKSLINHT